MIVSLSNPIIINTFLRFTKNTFSPGGKVLLNNHIRIIVRYFPKSVTEGAKTVFSKIEPIAAGASSATIGQGIHPHNNTSNVPTVNSNNENLPVTPGNPTTSIDSLSQDNQVPTSLVEQITQARPDLYNDNLPLVDDNFDPSIYPLAMGFPPEASDNIIDKKYGISTPERDLENSRRIFNDNSNRNSPIEDKSTSTNIASTSSLLENESPIVSDNIPIAPPFPPKFKPDKDGALLEVYVPPKSQSNVKFNDELRQAVEEHDSRVAIRSPLTPEITDELFEKVANRQSRSDDIIQELEELDNTVSDKALEAARNEIITASNEAIIKELVDRGLYDPKEGKLLHAFFEYWVKKHKTPTVDINIAFSEEQLQNPKFEIGMLAITNVDETLLLSGQQLHPMVLYVLNEDGKYVACGYLTSEKSEGCIELSNYQVFSETNKTQYIKFVKPYLLDSSNVEELPADQQAKVGGYLNAVSSVLSKNFNEKIVPRLTNNIPLDVYDGTGITKEEILTTLESYDQDQIKKANKLFVDYKKILNQMNPKKLNKWLSESAKSNTKHAYTHLLTLIKEHDNKNSN